MALPKPHRSGGPQTAAGRQAVAGNAMRTGAYAAQVVLPGEDPAHFQELEQQFLHDFAPADVAESALVHQLAVITWKKLRLDRIEHSNFLGFIHREYLPLELAPVAHLLPPVGALAWVNAMRHHSVSERDALAAAWQRATTLAVVPASGYPPDTLAHIQAQAPLLYQHLRLHAAEFNQPIPESDWLTTEVCGDDAQNVSFLAHGCASFFEVHDAGQWLLHHRDAAETAIRQLQEKRILMAMNQSGLNRIHDDLDRAFQRNLSELRRQQNWRRDRATVTVAVSPALQPPGP